MHRFIAPFVVLLVMLALPVSAFADTRALLVACSDFITQPDLGSAISGNLHLIGSALLGASPRPEISIEDGTIGAPHELNTAVHDAFGEADEDDLSILYLCTHGLLAPEGSDQMYLLLGNGEIETPLSGAQLYDILAPIQGEKLLILDACFSGALIGHGLAPAIPRGKAPYTRATPSEALPPSFAEMLAAPAFASPLVADSSIHVLTSANGYESSWYFDSSHLSTGAVSYFASAFASGLGLYGKPEADLNGDGAVTLEEMKRHLNVAVPSSSCQLFSARALSLALPTAQRSLLTRPLTGFSYGVSLLATDDPTLDFSFTVTQDTAIQYKLIEFGHGRWQWEDAQTFLDAGENEAKTLSPGRKTRSLTLSSVDPDDSGYVMLQIFSLQGEELILCSERLLAVQPHDADETIQLLCKKTFVPGANELVIGLRLDVPAEITVSVYDAEGALIRRLASAQLTRPTPDGVYPLYWDGRDAEGRLVAQGLYTITAEARVGGVRQKATADLTVQTAIPAD